MNQEFFEDRCAGCSKVFSEGDNGTSIESFTDMQPFQNEDKDLIELKALETETKAQWCSECGVKIKKLIKDNGLWNE